MLGLAALTTRSKVLSPLQNRQFSLLWFGQTVSELGNRIYSTALPFLVLDLGGTAAQISLALVFFAVPQLAFLLLGGVVVDRFSRRTTMLIADVARAVAVMLMAVLLLGHGLRVGHIYAVSASFGFFSAFFMPAATSLLPEIVIPERLVAANALRSLANQLNGIVGPLIGAALVVSGSFALALGFDAFSFLVSGLCLLGITAVRRRTAPEQETGASGRVSQYWRELLEGFRLVAASQWLWVTIVLFSLGNVFFGGAMQVALPLLAKEKLGGIQAFGLVTSSMALGAVLTALLLGRRGRPARRGLLAYGGVAVGGIALILISASQNSVQAGLAALALGGGITAFDLTWHATMQELVPQAALGRVASIDMLGSFALLPVGYVLAGAIVAVAGSAATLLFAGAGLVAVALTGASLRSIRELR